MNYELERLGHAVRRKLRLSHGEREEMLLALERQTGAKFEHLPVPSPFRFAVRWAGWSIFARQPVPVRHLAALGLAALILLGTGTSYAAEGSLPGDTLYGVKLHINERVRGSLAFSAEASARHEATLAERRVAEAEDLAARGVLSTEVQEDLETRFRGHVARFEEKIEELADDDIGRAEIAAELEAGVEARAAVLASLDPEETGRSRALAARLGDRVRNVADIKEKAEVRLAAAKSSEVEEASTGRRKAAERKVAEVALFLDRTQVSAGASTTDDAQVAVRRARELIVEGDAKVSAGEHGAALALYQRAHSAASSARIVVEGRVAIESNRSRWFGKWTYLDGSAATSAGAAVDAAAAPATAKESAGDADADANADVDQPKGDDSPNDEPAGSEDDGEDDRSASSEREDEGAGEVDGDADQSSSDVRIEVNVGGAGASVGGSAGGGVQGSVNLGL